MTSLQLLDRFYSENDFNALMELYNRHHDNLVKWIRSHYAVDKSVAENVVIETFEQVRDGEYNGESFDDWLCTLAGNCVTDVAVEIEKLRRRAGLTESLIESLPPIQQKALTIQLLYDAPEDFAADLLDVTPTEFRNIVRDGMASLAASQLVAA